MLDKKTPSEDARITTDLAKLNESSSAGLINDLLGPSTKALGKFYGEKIEAYLDKKRKRNVGLLISRFEEKKPSITIDATPRIADRVQEWSKEPIITIFG